MSKSFMRTRRVNGFNGYFETLPKSTQDIMRDALIKAGDERKGPSGYLDDKDCIKEIECHSRDGFIRSSQNFGGLMYRNFADLMDYFGGGYVPAHKGAAKEIQKQIDYAHEMLSKSIFENFGELLISKGLNENDCNYYKIQDLVDQGDDELKEVLRSIENGELESLSGSENSIMHELRVMYHGCEKGVHKASVSAALNTEGPYHRSHISWAPNIFCEGAKEIDINWRNNAELKQKLNKALAKVSKATF